MDGIRQEDLAINVPLKYFDNRKKDELDAAGYLREIESRRRRCQWTPEFTLDNAIAGLREGAHTWFTGMQNYEPRIAQDWGEFQRAFKKAFRIAGPTNRLDFKRALNQGNGETVAAYLRRQLDSTNKHVTLEAKEWTSRSEATSIKVIDRTMTDEYTAAFNAEASETTREWLTTPNADPDLEILRTNILAAQVAGIDATTANLSRQRERVNQNAVDICVMGIRVMFGKPIAIDGIADQKVRREAIRLERDGERDRNRVWTVPALHDEIALFEATNRDQGSAGTRNNAYAHEVDASENIDGPSEDVTVEAANAGKKPPPKNKGKGKGKGADKKKKGTYDPKKDCSFCKRKGHTIDECFKKKHADSFYANQVDAPSGAACGINTTPQSGNGNGW